jgi:hypothetical protein
MQCILKILQATGSKFITAKSSHREKCKGPWKEALWKGDRTAGRYFSRRAAILDSLTDGRAYQCR